MIPKSGHRFSEKIMLRASAARPTASMAVCRRPRAPLASHGRHPHWLCLVTLARSVTNMPMLAR
jgi:hypothetical protein